MGHGEISHPPLTEDELKLVLIDSHEEGVITEGEAKIIIRAFEFADKQAKKIMIPTERVDFRLAPPPEIGGQDWRLGPRNREISTAPRRRGR